MRTLQSITLSAFLLLAVVPAWGRVFLEWTEPAIPSAASIGVKELVIPWGQERVQLMKSARKLGYHVFAEAHSQDAAAAANAAAANGLAGIIVEGNSDQPAQGATHELVEKLRHSHPQLSVFELDPGGKQPQIRGNLIVKRHGVMQITSATRKPWIDSNVALVRFERAMQPKQAPLFSFSWDLTDPVERQEGPPSEDYALAVAEAGAMRADVILPVYPSLQKALAQGDKMAWKEWDRVKPYVKFYSTLNGQKSKLLADIALVTDNYGNTYEAMNLLARHNLPYRVLRPGEVTAQRLGGFHVVVMFSRPDAATARALQAFASAGGVVLLIDQHGPFPWETLPAIKTSDGTAYKVGSGKIIESAQPVNDPEAFAEEIRRLLNKQGISIYLWNAITTLGFAYPDPQTRSMVLELVNYAQEPLQVQVRIKGSFPNIRYATPGHGPYPAVPAEIDNGFTQFVISHLKIGARVYLSSDAKQP